MHDLMVSCITKAAGEVFSAMLGVELSAPEVSVERGTPEANDGVLSFIGLAGDWVGTGSLACSPVLACRICSQMLMTESKAVDEEVLDAIGELTNMIIGCAKNDLEHQLGPLGLSIPTVVYGKNFSTRSPGHEDWTVVPFEWEDKRLNVRLCLKPRAGASHQTVYGEKQQFVLGD